MSQPRLQIPPPPPLDQAQPTNNSPIPHALPPLTPAPSPSLTKKLDDIPSPSTAPRPDLHPSRKRYLTQRSLVLFLLAVLGLEILARNRQILGQISAPITRPLGLAVGYNGASHLTRPQDPVELSVASLGVRPERPENVPDAPSAYAASDIRSDWRSVIRYYMREMPVELFRADKIEEHFRNNENNCHKTTMLVHITNGNARFVEMYTSTHSRAASARYMLRKIAARKHHILRNVTLLVMLSDGHKPRVPTFGSARHWTNWELMLPVPLGNFRGHFQGWGTPLQGWDKYIQEHVLASHGEYSWYTKIGKAVFRGALAMQSFVLGSCNEVNGRECERATRWYQVNRGVMYVRARQRRDLFDVGFSALKPKKTVDPDQFEGAPRKALQIDFREFQKYKYIINCGSNQDWAERLRLLLFMNSAIVYHMAETQEFFTPLLKPWVHVIPTNITMEDLPANVEWAIRHDDVVKKIHKNQLAFVFPLKKELSHSKYWFYNERLF